MSKQVQLRRGTSAENEAFTGAVGELTVDTTNNGLRLHDAATPGGQQFAPLNYYVAGGTANAIVITPAPALGEYLAGQSFDIKVVSTNTGALTVKYGGLAVRGVTLQDGSALSGGEVVAGGVYTFKDDGTNIIVTNAVLPALVNISGLLPSSAADADHDVTISAGKAASADGSALLSLAGAMTKRIDAAFVAGDGSGGMFTGSVAADTTYHMHLIEKDSDGSIDWGWDTSIAAANIPNGYTNYRRVFSLQTDSSANIRSFHAVEVGQGVRVVLDDPVLQLSTGSPSTAGVNIALSLPVGLELFAHLVHRLNNASAASSYLSYPGSTNGVPGSNYLTGVVSSSGIDSVVALELLTNESAQIRYRCSVSNVIALNITLTGWSDQRS